MAGRPSKAPILRSLASRLASRWPSRNVTRDTAERRRCGALVAVGRTPCAETYTRHTGARWSEIEGTLRACGTAQLRDSRQQSPAARCARNTLNWRLAQTADTSDRQDSRPRRPPASGASTTEHFVEKDRK